VLTDTKPSELGGDEVTRHLSGASYCTDLSRQFSGHGAYHLWHDSPVTPERLALAEAATWRDSGRQIEQPIMMQRRKSEIQARLKHVDSNVSVGEESRESLLVMPLLTKGDYFGEYALLSKHPRSASVQAKEVGVVSIGIHPSEREKDLRQQARC
jgi:CRP-like cAMP-binding protein